MCVRAGGSPGAGQDVHENSHVPQPHLEPVGPAGHRPVLCGRLPAFLPIPREGRPPGLRGGRGAVEHPNPGDPEREPVPGALRQDHRKAGSCSFMLGGGREGNWGGGGG